MKLPDAPWRHRAGLDALFAALSAEAGAVRLVGGVVRDTLLGLPVTDIDLATRLKPEEAQARIVAAGFKAVPTGIAHGTVTAILPSGPVEVTTLRRDVTTDGRHAEVAFTDDWRVDAERRDFTINALFADPLTGAVSDPVGGLDDLDAGRVRFIGDPLRRIAEDHLRILRFFRFHARFGRGDPDAAGLAACAVRAGDLETLSPERTAQELVRLLGGLDPAPTLALMIAHTILAPVLPEIDSGGVARLARLVPRENGAADPIRRLAALLPADAATVERVARRLRLSNADRKRLVLAADPASPDKGRAIAYRFGPEAARDRLLLRADDTMLAVGLAALSDWTPPRLPIGGARLIALGIPPGPDVSTALAAIEASWIDEGFPDAARVALLAAHEVARRRL